MSFGGLSGAPPLSVRNQAMRGIAKVAMARGDRDGARKQYERILGKSLIGRGAPAEHWAHSEYAWLLFENGELAVSAQHISTTARQCVWNRIILQPFSSSVKDCEAQLSHCIMAHSDLPRATPGQDCAAVLHAACCATCHLRNNSLPEKRMHCSAATVVPIRLALFISPQTDLVSRVLETGEQGVSVRRYQNRCSTN